MYRRLSSLIVVLFIAMNIAYAQEEHWMPDPKLRKAVRETLGIPAHIPLTPAHLQSLTELNVEEKGVVELTGLAHATSLRRLFADKNSIRDISSLMNLTEMRFLSLNENQVVDITSLTGMQSLHTLKLGRNQVVDITPLAGLQELRHLALHYNRIRDFSPLAGLTNLDAIYTWGNVSVDLSMVDTSKIANLNIDWECDIQQPSARKRIQSRDYPSLHGVFGATQKIPTLSKEENIASHDLRYCCPGDLNLHWRTTTQGLKLIGNLEGVKYKLDTLRSLNPNLVLLVEVHYYSGVPWDHEVRWQHSIPDDVFLRDEKGDFVSADNKLLDFTLPQTQQFVRDQVLSLSKCGLFDGIFLDHWNEQQRLGEVYSQEIEHQARDTILQDIRGIVGEDFLILVNANHSKIPRWASYVNGLHMETIPGHSWGDKFGPEDVPNGEYTITDLNEIQDTLRWAEHALREPRINGLQAHLGGENYHQPNSPRNQQWMRFFTTMSLTLSDGYVDYGVYPHHWYDFWDAPLGRPIGSDETKGQLYENRAGMPIEGIFIREFTNGWAVYNHSGKARKIYLPEKVSAVASGVKNKHWHTIPDLDGEILLKKTTSPVNEIKKTTAPADVNNDGKVNIEDIRLVLAAIGVEPTTTTRVDVNEDGTVNVVDLQTVIDNLDNPTTAEAPTLRDDLSGTFNAALLRAELNRLGTDTQQFTEAIALLKRLLASTLPEQTLLLANYPNPFNPETWIPYHLATDTDVEIRIYDTRGSLVRRLELGHQRAGIYTGRGRAAYWDGRNEMGERVASGIYFYQLQADGLSYLRKMVILK